MDFRNLMTFIQVAELSSFTRAAEKMGYSQPTVSLQIKQLEQELGTQLFDRVGHTVSLTDAGHEALAYAQRICQLSQEMISGRMENREPQGLVRLAMAASLSTQLIQKCFHEIRRLYPGISLRITNGGTDELFRLLDHNEADIVCTMDSHFYSSAYIIAHEEKIGVHFVVSAEHPLAEKEDVQIADLLDQPFLLTEKNMSYSRILHEAMAKYSLEIHPVLEFGDADQLCLLCERNMGVSFLPDYVTEEAVREGRLKRLHVKDIQPDLWKQILVHRDKWVSRQMRAIIDHLSSVLLQKGAVD